MTQSAAEVLKKMQKDAGEAVGSFGGKLVDTVRIPTGIFAFDLATGGGFPRGRVSCIYGPESSSKTNLALLAIRNHQLMFPTKTCVFVDIEHSFDPVWAKKLGVDVSKLIVVQPTHAEMAIQYTCQFMEADDIGVIVVDSLAMLATQAELEKPMETGTMGGSSLIIGRMVRRTTASIANNALAEKEQPTLIYINQTRQKIGVMFGDPETMPGGAAPRFQLSLWVRVYGKNVMENKVSQNLPTFKNVKATVKKWKVPILSLHAEFDMVMIPHKGLTIGMADDFNTLKEYLSDLGELEKVKEGWKMLGTPYKTLELCKKEIYENKEFGNSVRSAVIEAVLGKAEALIEGDNMTEQELEAA